MNVANRAGFLLSGGVDTAAIVGAASVQSSKTVQTFTLRFSDSAEVDESAAARTTSEYLKTEHAEVDVTSACVDFLPAIAAFGSSPPANASALISFSLFKQISSAVDTVFCGDGGNDLLGGHYRYNQVMAYAQHFQRTALQRFVLKHGRRAYHLLKGTRLEARLQVAARSFFSRVGSEMAADPAVKMEKTRFDEVVDYYIDSDSFWRTGDKQLLYSESFSTQINGSSYRHFLESLFDFERRVGVFQQLPFVRVNSFIPYVAMQYVEPTATLNEVRPLFPLLDRELMEFIYRVPFQSIYGKSFRHLMRKALARRILSDEIFERPTKGFRVPIEKWMRSRRWKELVYDHLGSDAVKNRGWFSESYIRGLLHRFYSGKSYRRDNSFGNVTSLGLLIWSLVALESWARHHIDE
jgi:asparagine synthase (glutamine-hydrolysing)